MVEDTSMYAGVVYGIHNGDFNYRYIGKTQQTLRRRFNDHLRDADKGVKRPLHDWIRKHRDSIQVCVIATFDEDTIHLINEVEINQIAQSRAEGGNLNVSVGGDGQSKGYKHTPEAVAKFSASLRGRKQSPDHVAKVAAAFAGKPRSPEMQEVLRVSSSLGTHTRWHLNRGIIKEGCGHCGER